jgi:hypothetical protein
MLIIRLDSVLPRVQQATIQIQLIGIANLAMIRIVIHVMVQRPEHALDVMVVLVLSMETVHQFQPPLVQIITTTI